MKSILSRNISILSFIISLFLVNSCEQLDLKRVMDVSTDSVEKIGTSVIVHGTVLDLGHSNIISHGHCWSTNPEPDINDFSSNLGIIEGTGRFFSKLNNLLPGVVHYVRSYIFDGNEYVYGNVDTFRITSNDIQFAISAIQKLDATDIKVIASTNGIGSVNFTNHGHCWSQAESPTINDNKTEFGIYNSDTSFESEISNLVFGRYYIRGYLQSNDDVTYTSTIIYESEIALKTDNISPNIDNTMTVGSTIICLGVNPILKFGHCWSTLTSLPDLNNLSEHSEIGHTNQLGSFSSNLEGLISGRSYYVRAYASDGEKIYYGEIKNFIAN